MRDMLAFVHECFPTAEELPVNFEEQDDDNEQPSSGQTTSIGNVCFSRYRRNFESVMNAIIIKTCFNFNILCIGKQRLICVVVTIRYSFISEDELMSAMNDFVEQYASVCILCHQPTDETNMCDHCQQQLNGGLSIRF